MKIFLLALVLVAFCVIGLCFNIIFRKNGEFPQTEIESNVEMKKLGIRCVKAEEMALHRRGSKDKPSCEGDGDGCTGCAGCSFYDDKK